MATRAHPEFREAIEYVAIDPAAVYAAATRTEGLLPNATLVVDHFHLVKLANDTVTKVRRRVTWELKDRRGGKIDPEWANRRRLLTARERLSDRNLHREGGTPHAAIHREVRRRPAPDPASAAPVPRLVHRLEHPRAPHPAKTIDTLWPEINAFVSTGITNARTEGYNRLVKAVKRAGCGFRNRENSARRIRFHCTRKQRAATQTSC
jgi:transposase